MTREDPNGWQRQQKRALHPWFQRRAGAEKRAELAAQFREGASISALAEQHLMSRNTVRRYLIDEGVVQP